MASGRAALVESPLGDLVISQGADNRFAFIYGTSESDLNPELEHPDLTSGWDARAQLRAGRTGPGSELWLSLTTTVVDGTGIVLGDAGQIWVLIDHRETEKPEWNSESRARGEWDLELVKPSGEVVRLVMGRVRLSFDVTRHG